MARKTLLLLFWMISTLISLGQGANLKHAFGLAVHFSYATSERASINFSLNYAAYTLMNPIGSIDFLPSYQGSLNIYYNGIGSNYIDNNFNIDFHHSLAVTGGWRKPGHSELSARGFYYIKQSYLKSAEIIPYSSNASFTIASNFILNNHNRNQYYGSFTLQPIPYMRVQYYNDGGSFISHLKLGDTWDRWWTGGGFVEFGNDFNGTAKQAFPKIRLSYNRFTWENEKLFKFFSLLGLPLIPLSEEKKDKVFFNSGQYSLRVSWRNEDFILKANNIFPDGQDYIHRLLKSSKHNTYGSKYWALGINKNIRLYK